VLSSLGGITKLHKRKVEQAAFVVLKAPDVPSILVETGYLSNPEEARLLSQAGHQRKMARAIFDGVVAYLGTHPPPGTLLAQQQGKGGTRYVIRRGDTLSEIAEHYSVSARRLREANGLANDVIKVGQVLVIPTT
jgi:N-acetylmuramoyl-L-alanine amidase